MLLAHAGNRLALDCRDSIVGRAHRSDPAARADDSGAHAVAAAFDFFRNLGLGAVPDTVGGLTLVLPVSAAPAGVDRCRLALSPDRAAVRHRLLVGVSRPRRLRA